MKTIFLASVRLNTVNVPPPSKVSTGIVDAGADGDDNDDRLPVQGAHRWLQRAPSYELVLQDSLHPLV